MYKPTRPIDEQISQIGLLTGNCGSCRRGKAQTPLASEELLVFTNILNKIANQPSDISLLNYLIEDSDVTCKPGDWIMSMLGKLCPRGLDHYRLLRTFIVPNYIQLIHPPDDDIAYAASVRSVLSTARHCDVALLKAQSLLNNICGFMKIPNESVPISEHTWRFCSFIETYSTAIVKMFYIAQTIIEIPSIADKNQLIRELDILRSKCPELESTIDKLKNEKYVLREKLVKNKPRMTQREAANVIKGIARMTNMKKYENCSRETICHWERNRTSTPPWYSSEKRHLYDIGTFAEYVKPILEREYRLKDTLRNLSHPLRYSDSRDNNLES
ncbi:MAG: hypothetical protein AB7F40_09565 [Victivallaceae bacterium]